MFSHPQEIKPAQQSEQIKNNVQWFFEHYPAREIWRFFVEVDRYDYRKTFYTFFEQGFSSWDEIKKQPIRALYQYVEDENSIEIKEIIKGHFYSSTQNDCSIEAAIEKQVAWLGFEEREPGYLQGVISGFALLIKELVEKQPLSMKFIRELHRITVNNVKNMLSSCVGGVFRKNGISWFLTENWCSQEGLKEKIKDIRYLKNLANSKTDLFNIIIRYQCSSVVFYNAREQYHNNKELLTVDNEVFLFIWSHITVDNLDIYFEVEKVNQPEEFFITLHKKLLAILNETIKKGKNKTDKLSAIFTYLRHMVMLHPFADGMGRTFSMLLLQYLLMQQNLLPVFLKDSNMIPGFSVKELVDNYLIQENNIKLACDGKDFSSALFALPHENVSTEKLYQDINKEEKEYFDHCIAIYQQAVDYYLKYNHDNASALGQQLKGMYQQ